MNEEETILENTVTTKAIVTNDVDRLAGIEDTAIDTVQSRLESGYGSSDIISPDLLLDSQSIPAETLSARINEFLAVGGPVVWVLSIMSLFALTIILIKCWQFAVLRPERRKEIDRSLSLWMNGEFTAAKKALPNKHIIADVTSLAMDGLMSHSRNIDLLKEELNRVATLKLEQLRAYLRPLEVIATLSPLLGLLGTVLGMIVAFQQMEAAGSQVDPSVLSGGIWQALFTTAVGLSVAIPVVAVHNLLERKVDRVAALMNDVVTQVFTRQPAESEKNVFRKDSDNAA
ncbi:MAG: MotA/TolQ/ExbB proton channel family protein [Piscirickettsiaceae bacterium]|nr:MotA/TolQ/ExbB proton channel family protein [Piscirickettsiaceae bacterium]